MLYGIYRQGHDHKKYGRRRQVYFFFFCVCCPYLLDLGDNALEISGLSLEQVEQMPVFPEASVQLLVHRSHALRW